MQGKILLVEHRVTERILLRACLADACYDVVLAESGADALARIHEGPDAVILAADLPGTDCARFCAAMCAATHPVHIPMIVLTSAQSTARIQLIAAGADDVLGADVGKTELLARLRGLLRQNGADREWRMAGNDHRRFLTDGFGEAKTPFSGPAKVTLLSDLPDHASRLVATLTDTLPYDLAPEPLSGALARLDALSGPEIIALAPSSAASMPEVLALLADLAARPATRDRSSLVLLPPDAGGYVADCIDRGADDVIRLPAGTEEIALRLGRQATRNADRARARLVLRDGILASVRDPLTGLYNRRFAMPRLARIVEHALQSGQPFAVLMVDIDHFKTVNDRYGHPTGDGVLVEVAKRLQAPLCPDDMIARIGGEEFLIVLPDTAPRQAVKLARRLCQEVARSPVAASATGQPVRITLSIGVSAARVVPGGLDVETLIGAADRALYASKAAGRNTVTLNDLAA